MVVVVDRTSVLGAPSDEVWRHATSMAGVNAELAPIRMSHPPGRDAIDRWRHRRTVTPRPHGCVLRDVVEVEPRLPGAGWLTRWVVRRIFDRRHRVLVTRFGGTRSPAGTDPDPAAGG